MNEHKVDRSGWEPGPWDGEPDKVNWTTEAGLPGMIVRNGAGALCGYVAVTKGHPWFGVKYGYQDGCPDSMVQVHGGLTYSEKCAGAICHVPKDGEEDDVWWFGFDCNHSGDLAPGRGVNPMRMLYGLFGSDDFSSRYDGEYRTVDYVRGEVESLAKQIAKAAA